MVFHDLRGDRISGNDQVHLPDTKACTVVA